MRWPVAILFTVSLSAVGASTARAQDGTQPQPQPQNPPAAVDPYNPYGTQPEYQPPAEPPPPATTNGQVYGDPNAPDADLTMVDDTENTDDGWQPEAYADFQEALSPYGQWVTDPVYGQIWAPSTTVVGADFYPYASNGHWVLTEYGWTWVSDWDWGWAPFHYGRWLWYGTYGWCWRPGRIWGPGWVSWRSGGGYAGWAPLGPRGRYVPPPPGRSPWHFVAATHLGAANSSYLHGGGMRAVFRQTRPIANVQSVGGAHWNAGPSGAQLGRSIESTPIRALPAQHVLPRAAVQPHPAVSWPRPTTMSVAPRPSYPAASTFQRPAYTAPTYRAPTQPYAQPYSPYRAPTYPAPSYQQPYRQPTYTAPTPSYHYQAPSPSYHYQAPTPSYHYQAPAAPTYHYQSPTFHAPSAPSYSRPSYSHPTFSAPRSTGGFRRR